MSDTIKLYVSWCEFHDKPNLSTASWMDFIQDYVNGDPSSQDNRSIWLDSRKIVDRKVDKVKDWTNEIGINFEKILHLQIRAKARKPFAEAVNALDQYRTGKWAAFRKYYKEAMQDILAYPKNELALPEDEIKWRKYFTAIEYDFYFEARSLSVVIYPQFPVLQYFVDFANPVAKVAIECDGKKYHADNEKDQIRAKRIISAGWTLYRFTGRECLDLGKLACGLYDDRIDPETAAFGHVDMAINEPGQKFRKIAIEHGIARHPGLCETKPPVYIEL